MCAGLYGHPVD